jgi:hypothetical protein
MEQPGDRTPKSRFIKPPVVISVTIICCGAVLLVYVLSTSGKLSSHDVSIYVALITAGAAVLGAAIPLVVSLANGMRRDEARARQRVRQAEDDLTEALRGGAQTNITILGNATISRDSVATEGSEQGSVDEQVSLKRRDDGLALAALWKLTHTRLDEYHTIVTGQAKSSFIASQVAMGFGFVLLVVFAWLAADAKTTTAAIGAGGLGAVSAALAGYIAKTLIRSQESAASQLAGYFAQPLELSRYLAAERLLADAADLTAEQRAAIVSSLVEAIATAGHENGKPEGNKPRGRQARSKQPG